MEIFSNFFRRLSRREERRISESSSSFSNKAQKDNPMENSAATSNSVLVTSSVPSSKEGKSFKFNEAGRQYHGMDDVAYVFPNDDDEKDRLHEQHWILKYVLQRNYLAPVTKLLEEGITVLDSGCGPATWTFEMAECYPLSKFYGIDISFVFPELIKPANVELVIGNVTKEITYPNNTFDYIHQRLFIAALTSENWDSTLRELYRILKPGGYIELGEIDVQNYVRAGPILSKVQDMTKSMFAARGFPDNLCYQLGDLLKKAGFVNPIFQITPMALNHNGQAGELFWKDFRHGYENVRPALASVNIDWESPEKFGQYLDACYLEAADYKTALNFYACYAQKPQN